MPNKEQKVIMPIYPPRNNATKKRQILDYKIFELNKYIETEKSNKKINEKVELVRVAMLLLIKARLTVMKSYKSDDVNEKSIQMCKN